jgi:hypothetical protein
MIISLNKFKSTGGSGGNTGGGSSSGGSGINLTAAGYDKLDITNVNNIINDSIQETIDAYYEWAPNSDNAYGFYQSRNFEYAPAIDTRNVTTMEYMFANCNNLKYVPKYDTSNVYNTIDMFRACHNLKKVEIDLTGVSLVDRMFFDCWNLEEVKFTGDASGVYQTNQMFDGILNENFKVTFNDNGTFGSIISAAEEYGKRIEVILSKDIATFKYWVKDEQGRYLRNPLLMDRYYALVGDQKYPLIYKGNAKYAVELDGEADMVELHVNGETTTIYTGQDNGTINEEYILSPEINYSDWANICTSLSNASYDNGDGRLHVILDGMNNSEIKFKIYLTNYTEQNQSIGYELSLYNADYWGGMVRFTDLTTYEEQRFEGMYNDFRVYIRPDFIQTDDNGHFISFKLNFMTYDNGYPVQFDFIQLKNVALNDVNIEDTVETGDNLIIYDAEGYNSNGNIEIKLDGSEYGTDAYDRVIPMDFFYQDVVDQFGDIIYSCANLYGYTCKMWENKSLQLKLTNLNNNLEYKFLTDFADTNTTYKIYYPSNMLMTTYRTYSFEQFEVIKQSETGISYERYGFTDKDSIILEPGAWIILKNTDNKNIVGYGFKNLRSVGDNAYNYSNKLEVLGGYIEPTRIITSKNQYNPYWTTGFLMLRNISEDTTLRIDMMQYYGDLPECNNITKYHAIGVRFWDTTGRLLNQSHLEGHTFTCNGQNLTAGSDGENWYVDFPGQFAWYMYEIGQPFLLKFDDTEHNLVNQYTDIYTNIELSLTDLYGNPDDAIPVTFEEFYNAEADTNQWYQLSGNIVCMPAIETGCIVIQNDAGQYMYIDGIVDCLMEGNNQIFSTFYYNGTYFDGAPITVKTRKIGRYHELEVNGEIIGVDGVGGGDPPAIFINIDETPTYDNLWLVDTDGNSVAQFTQTVETNANEYTVNTVGLLGDFTICNLSTGEYYSIPDEYTNEIYGKGPTGTVTNRRKYHINFNQTYIKIDGSESANNYFLHINIPEDYIGFIGNNTGSISGDNYTE